MLSTSATKLIFLFLSLVTCSSICCTLAAPVSFEEVELAPEFPSALASVYAAQVPPTMDVKSASASASASAAAPAGVWYGQMGIVPYSGTTRHYACTTCSAVYAPTYVTFYPNHMTIINITAAHNGQCGVNTQGYVIENVRPAGGHAPYTYTGRLTIEGVTIPVCYFMNGQQFSVVLDGQGTCASQATQPVCINGWTPGTVTQDWTGSFTQTALPAGLWNGDTDIVPYQNVAGGGYACTACAALRSRSWALWSANTLTLGLGAVHGPSGCSLNGGYVLFHTVEPYSNQYPGYFRAVMNVAGTPNVCFRFSNTGEFTLLVDGSGNCPHPAARAACANTSPGKVQQVWTGLFHA